MSVFPLIHSLTQPPQRFAVVSAGANCCAPQVYIHLLSKPYLKLANHYSQCIWKLCNNHVSSLATVNWQKTLKHKGIQLTFVITTPYTIAPFTPKLSFKICLNAVKLHAVQICFIKAANCAFMKAKLVQLCNLLHFFWILCKSLCSSFPSVFFTFVNLV